MFSVIIPSYNEEDYIESNLKKIINKLRKYRMNYELIVVEESNDRTSEIVSNLAKRYPKIRHLHFDHRLGKGKAIEKGIEVAKGKYIIFTDADLSTDLSSLKLVKDNLQDHDIVIGSRYHPSSKSNRTFLRLILSRAYSVCVKILLGINRPRDLQCGIKGFRKDVVVKVIPLIRNKGFFWDTEFLFHAKRLNYKIKEIPVIWIEKKVRGSGSGRIKNIIYMAKSLLKLTAKNIIN